MTRNLLVVVFLSRSELFGCDLEWKLLYFISCTTYLIPQKLGTGFNSTFWCDFAFLRSNCPVIVMWEVSKPNWFLTAPFLLYRNPVVLNVNTCCQFAFIWLDHNKFGVWHDFEPIKWLEIVWLLFLSRSELFGCGSKWKVLHFDRRTNHLSQEKSGNCPQAWSQQHILLWCYVFKVQLPCFCYLEGFHTKLILDSTFSFV
jgi:hypothetical protein